MSAEVMIMIDIKYRLNLSGSTFESRFIANSLADIKTDNEVVRSIITKTSWV